MSPSPTALGEGPAAAEAEAAATVQSSKVAFLNSGEQTQGHLHSSLGKDVCPDKGANPWSNLIPSSSSPWDAKPQPFRSAGSPAVRASTAVRSARQTVLEHLGVNPSSPASGSKPQAKSRQVVINAGQVQQQVPTQASPPMPPDVALKFLEALRAEYVLGQESAVGDFHQRLQVPDHMVSILDSLEDQIRDAPDASAAVSSLATQWGFPGPTPQPLSSSPSPSSASSPPWPPTAPASTHALGECVSPPVHPDVARGFLGALWTEFVLRQQQAVGDFFSHSRIPEEVIDQLEPIEDQIREASDPAAAITKLATQWGLPNPAPAPSPSAWLPQAAPAAAAPAAFAQVAPFNGRPSRRRAVLIGINYFRTSAELRGCINDVHNLRSLLSESLGWDPACIRTLTDDSQSCMPTRSNVENALRWLVEDVRPGDSLFLHFSGHGAQEEDPNGYEEDGMHETILPVDFQQAGMITDDQINDLVVKPLPDGARLTVVMDCCHSGTGMDLPFMHTSHGWREETNPFHTRGDVQLFSGCEDEDTSADAAGAFGQAGGAMTTAFCDVLRQDPSPTYPELMARLHDLMRRRGFSQRPQLTSSQAFGFDRPFHLDDAIQNSNQHLGRIFRKKFPPRPRPMSGPLAELLGTGVAVVGGIAAAGFAMEVASAFGASLF